MVTVASVKATLRAGVPCVSPPVLLPAGATCEVVLAPCAPSPCRNGGECRASEDYESFSCVCPTGWQGEAGRLPTALAQADFLEGPGQGGRSRGSAGSRV